MENILKSEKLDDPIWEYMIATRLLPYIPQVKEFWDNYAEVNVSTTGTRRFRSKFPVPDDASGLMYRVTMSPSKSPIKNVQVFPYVPLQYLNLTGVPGGLVAVAERVCQNNAFKLEGFIVVFKYNLPSTYHNGPIFAFIPENVMNDAGNIGAWVYLKQDETLFLLSKFGKEMPSRLADKFMSKLDEDTAAVVASKLGITR